MAWIILAVVAVLIIAAVAVYNNLVRCRKEVDNGWAQIDVQLKRRCDLIPNLVETVKGYAAHESGLLEKVTQARSAAMSPNLEKPYCCRNPAFRSPQRSDDPGRSLSRLEGKPELPCFAGRTDFH